MIQCHCADGTVSGLQGNQCKFGRGNELVDWRNEGKDPLVDEMDGFDLGDKPETTEAPSKPEVMDEELEDEDPYKEDKPIQPLPTAPPPEEDDDEDFLVPMPLIESLPTAIPWEDEIIEWMVEEIEHEKEEEEDHDHILPFADEGHGHDDHDHDDFIDPDETWAEYYDRLDPGFADEHGRPLYASIPGPVLKGASSQSTKLEAVAFKAKATVARKPAKGAKRQQRESEAVVPFNAEVARKPAAEVTRPATEVARKPAKGAKRQQQQQSNGGGRNAAKKRASALSSEGSGLNVMGYASGTQARPAAARGVLKGGDIHVARAGARPRRRKGSSGR